MMFSTFLSLAIAIFACLSILILVAFVLFFRLRRIPNDRQIKALRLFMPTDAKRPAELLSVDLERLAAYLYQRLGYKNVKHTGVHSTTDGGVDVWMLNHQGNVEIVQCKQWRNRVGSTELIEFAKVMRQQHAEIGHFWSPMGFTKPAMKYAQSSRNTILLYDDYLIRKLLEQVGEIEKNNNQPPDISAARDKKGWTVSQVIIIFGMLLVSCSLIYYLISMFVINR